MKLPICSVIVALFFLAACASPDPLREGDTTDGPSSPTLDASEGALDEPTTIDTFTPEEIITTDASTGPDSLGTPEEPNTPEQPNTPETPDTPEVPEAPMTVKPRLLVLGKNGRIASLQLTSPWTVLSTGDLKQPTASARCFGGRCVVVHPSPADSLSLVDPLDLASSTKIQLDRGADPRDVAFVDEKTIVVSQYGKSALLVINLGSGSKESIDLGALADADTLPEALRMAHCGRRVFVQLLRIDHKTGAPTTMGPGLAVIDLDEKGTNRIVDADPGTPGKQAIGLSGSPNFDMPINCKTGQLSIAEPKPLMKGGGWYEQVNLKTLEAGKSPINHGAQVGGFAVVAPGLYWLITHTATGPAGNSSHLNLEGGSSNTTYNTFADDKVEELALDLTQDLLFFPDNCEVKPSNPQCQSGVHVFHARTGVPQPKGVIQLGFPPMELAISR